MNHRNPLRTAGTIGLLAVLMPGLAPLFAEPLRVPAFTAYTLPDAEGARISERSGVTRWTDPALSVNLNGSVPAIGKSWVAQGSPTPKSPWDLRS